MPNEFDWFQADEVDFLTDALEEEKVPCPPPLPIMIKESDILPSMTREEALEILLLEADVKVASLELRIHVMVLDNVLRTQNHDQAASQCLRVIEASRRHLVDVTQKLEAKRGK
jgi:hypothetical protein